jgi:hypothetical protein
MPQLDATGLILSICHGEMPPSSSSSSTKTVTAIAAVDVGNGPYSSFSLISSPTDLLPSTKQLLMIWLQDFVTASIIIAPSMHLNANAL